MCLQEDEGQESLHEEDDDLLAYPPMVCPRLFLSLLLMYTRKLEDNFLGQSSGAWPVKSYSIPDPNHLLICDHNLP